MKTESESLPGEGDHTREQEIREDLREWLKGCQNNPCYVKRATGMHTNGRCRCADRLGSRIKYLPYLLSQNDQLRERLSKRCGCGWVGDKTYQECADHADLRKRLEAAEKLAHEVGRALQFLAIRVPWHRVLQGALDLYNKAREQK